MQCFHYFCRPAWHSSMFQVANLMQSGTLEVFFRPPPTVFPAGHQVYDLHNDGNSILQFGQVPHRSVSRRQMGLPTRYYWLYPTHFCCHTCWIKRNWSKVFLTGCPSCWNHSLDLIFSVTTKTAEQGMGVTPFMSAVCVDASDTV